MCCDGNVFLSTTDNKMSLYLTTHSFAFQKYVNGKKTMLPQKRAKHFSGIIFYAFEGA